MTMILQMEEKCFVCGTSSVQMCVSSTISFGPSDLDTRPGPMARDILKDQIHCCPSCGYCSPDLSAGPEAVRHIVKSEEYRHRADDATFPIIANHFLCESMIADLTGGYAEAGWAAVCAAWICDDDESPPAAVSCRERAIRFFLRCRASGISFAERVGSEEALLADLYRRTGQFDRVAGICQEGLAKNPESTIRQILDYQMVLADQRDTRCHKANEAAGLTTTRAGLQ